MQSNPEELYGEAWSPTKCTGKQKASESRKRYAGAEMNGLNVLPAPIPLFFPRSALTEARIQGADQLLDTLPGHRGYPQEWQLRQALAFKRDTGIKRLSILDATKLLPVQDSLNKASPNNGLKSGYGIPGLLKHRSRNEDFGPFDASEIDFQAMTFVGSSINPGMSATTKVR
jgi:hypothetical protein